ncbi:DoxX family protein [Phormidesmis sp. 146-33]
MTVMQAKPSFLATVLQSSSSENRSFQLAWVLLRVVVGLLMIPNGLDKLADVQGFATGVVKFLGLPYPVFFTYCAAYVEIVSSILLALGLLTRLDAFALLFTMLVAIYFHIKGEGLHIKPLEMASLYAVSFGFLLVNGGGLFSIDTLLSRQLNKS